MSLYETPLMGKTATTTKRGSRGKIETPARKVGQALIRLGDRIVRKAGEVFEIPKSAQGKLLYQVLTGAKPTGRGDWARVAADEINREELDQMIAALSAIRFALGPEQSDSAVAARLTALGFDDKYARQIASNDFYTVGYIDAHWRDIQKDLKVDNPRGLLRFRLTNRMPIPTSESKYEGWE